jgi:hypothetical protein
MSLVQITKVEGRIMRVPKGETPIIELNLDEDRRVINVARLEPIDPYSRANEDRKTLDWKYTVYVEWRMGRRTA